VAVAIALPLIDAMIAAGSAADQQLTCSALSTGNARPVSLLWGGCYSV
jgi:hypothetical protein